MRIYLFEELRSDPRGLAKRVATYAGLDPGFFDDFSFQTYNQTFAIRSSALHNLNIAVRGLLPKGSLYDAGRMLYRRINTKAAARQTASDLLTLAELKRYFQEENRQLSAEFDLDLSSWA